MKTSFRMLLLASLTATVAAFAAPAPAAEMPILMLASDDSDRDTAPRGNRVSGSTMLALGKELIQRGYKLFDEAAAGIAPDRGRLSETNLVDIARAIPGSPIDAVVVVKIYVSSSISRDSNALIPQVRIPVRIIDARSRQLVDAFEVKPESAPPFPPACDRECVLNHMGDHAATLAPSFGKALATALQAWRR